MNARAGLVLLGGVSLACTGPAMSGSPRAAGVPHVALSTDDSNKVYSYLECIECVDGELDSVLALGDSGAALLGHFLVNGPPQKRVARLKKHLDSLYVLVQDEIAESDDTADAPTRAEYVGVPLENYAATYRVRASRALSQIRGSGARRFLDSARTLDAGGAWPRRPDVSASIRAALDSL